MATEKRGQSFRLDAGKPRIELALADHGRRRPAKTRRDHQAVRQIELISRIGKEIEIAIILGGGENPRQREGEAKSGQVRRPPVECQRIAFVKGNAAASSSGTKYNATAKCNRRLHLFCRARRGHIRRQAACNRPKDAISEYRVRK